MTFASYKRVDQGDETLGFVVVRCRELGDVFKDQDADGLRDCEVIAGTKGTGAKFPKAGTGDAVGEARHLDRATIDGEREGFARCAPGQIRPDGVHFAADATGGVEIDLRALQAVLAVICRTLEFHDMQTVMDQVDEGQEERAVQTVL